MTKLQAQLDEHGVKMTPHFVGDGLCNLFQIPAGKLIGQHAHKIAHQSVLLLGSALVRIGGFVEQYAAPATITIEAGEKHEIEAVTDVLWACNWPDAQGLLDAEEFAQAVTA